MTGTDKAQNDRMLMTFCSILNFLKKFDVTIDITTKECYSEHTRCNNKYYNKQEVWR